MNDNIKAGADIHAGDGGYSIGTQENYDAFVKVRNASLDMMYKDTGIIFVIAGTYDQYKMFKLQLATSMAEEGIEFRYHDISYVHDSSTLRGHRNLWGYRVGSWSTRADLSDIEMMIRLSGSTMDEFIEVEI